MMRNYMGRSCDSFIPSDNDHLSLAISTPQHLRRQGQRHIVLVVARSHSALTEVDGTKGTRWTIRRIDSAMTGS
jgi:hypothetical protein